MNRIDCFIPYVNDEQVAVTLANLNSETEVARVIPLDASSFKSTASIKMGIKTSRINFRLCSAVIYILFRLSSSSFNAASALSY